MLNTNERENETEIKEKMTIDIVLGATLMTGFIVWYFIICTLIDEVLIRFNKSPEDGFWIWMWPFWVTIVFALAYAARYMGHLVRGC